MEDESSETSTPEPLIKRKKVVETQEAAATSEKSLEATSKKSLEASPEPPAPVADTTSPQQAIEPSTVEDQTTPFMSSNASPIATHVVRFTDEEDVQTQDTQDQSQDF